jgi:hypothetical protein
MKAGQEQQNTQQQCQSNGKKSDPVRQTTWLLQFSMPGTSERNQQNRREKTGKEKEDHSVDV